jgi:cytochrome c556
MSRSASLGYRVAAALAFAGGEGYADFTGIKSLGVFKGADVFAKCRRTNEPRLTDAVVVFGRIFKSNRRGRGVFSMMRLSRFLIGCAILVAVTAPTLARADDQDVIDYREHIMKTMGEQVAAMTQILKQKAPAENFAIHVQVLAITAATAKKAFEPKVLGGEAKPDVWAQWPDFTKRLDELTAITADLAKIAKTGGVAAAAPKAQTLTCKNCHDTYRVEKKK